MPGPLARRLVLAPAVLLLTTLVVFGLPQLTGVDPTRAALRARAAEAEPDPATLERLRAELGLDRPAPVRYLAFLRDLAHGDLGNSYTSRQPVVPDVGRAVGVSLSLLSVAMAAALAVALPLGLYTAARPGRWLDRTVRAMCWTAVSVPEYILGPALVLALGLWLGLLPTSGWSSPASLVLPACTLAAFPAGMLTQVIRAETRDALTQPYITAARARGVPPARLLVRHAGRVSLVSTVALGSNLTASMLGGAVVVEVIFAVPGLGRLLYAAVIDADLPMLQGGLLAAVAAALALGLLADVLHAALDPTARFT